MKIWVPLVALVPFHAPLAEHDVVLVLSQLSVVEPLFATVNGVALNINVGIVDCGCTVTVTDRTTLPPAPLHVSVYIPVLVNASSVCMPLVVFVPLHALLAAQVVASVLDQVNVVDSLYAIMAGFALMVTVGISGASTVIVTDSLALPPLPLQVKV